MTVSEQYWAAALYMLEYILWLNIVVTGQCWISGWGQPNIVKKWHRINSNCLSQKNLIVSMLLETWRWIFCSNIVVDLFIVHIYPLWLWRAFSLLSFSYVSIIRDTFSFVVAILWLGWLILKWSLCLHSLKHFFCHVMYYC